MTRPTQRRRRAVVLFIRDLRLHDNPALDLACGSAAEVIPVFVSDPVVLARLYMQAAAAFPDITTRGYRPRRDDWRDDPQASQAWCAGQTGIPIVDAGMRQLQGEGFMHNRAVSAVPADHTGGPVRVVARRARGRAQAA